MAGLVSSQGAPKTGTGSCGTNNAQTPIGYIGLPVGTELDMSSATQLKTLLADGTGFIIKGSLSNFEPQNEEDPIIEGTAGFRLRARDGKPRDSYTVQAPISVLNELSELNSNCISYDMIRIMANGALDGHHYDVTAQTLQGYRTSMISVGTTTAGADDAKAAKTILIDYKTPSQMNKYRSIVTPLFDITSIDGVSLAYLSVNGDGDIVVSYDSSEYDLSDTINIFGLSADFVDATGASVSGITESPSNSGIYTGFTAGTYTLADPADQADEDLKYYATNSATIS